MKRTKVTIARLLLLAVLAGNLSGCIKDNLSECGTSLTVTVKAYARNGDELGRESVQDVILFVFDSGYKFVQRIDTRLGEPVPVSPAPDGLHIVAWGNLSGGRQAFFDPYAGTPAAGCHVELLQEDGRLPSVLPPDDLFRGMINVPGNATREVVLPIYREVGSLTVTVRNLTEEDAATFRVVVRADGSRIDFLGNVSGDPTLYRPDGSMKSGGTGEYHIPAFNMFPDGTGILLDLYRGEELLACVSHDGTGNPIYIEKGMLTNVLVDMKSSLGVSVVLNDWGKYESWKEF